MILQPLAAYAGKWPNCPSDWEYGLWLTEHPRGEGHTPTPWTAKTAGWCPAKKSLFPDRESVV